MTRPANFTKRQEHENDSLHRRDALKLKGVTAGVDLHKESAMDSDILVTFWGVRGSIASPGLHTVGFGGNTSCVSVETRDQLVILDAGSGIRDLGQYLLKGNPK